MKCEETFSRISQIREGEPDPRKRSYGSPSKDTFPRIGGVDPRKRSNVSSSKDTFPQIGRNGPVPRKRKFPQISEGDPDPRKWFYGSPSKNTFPRIEGSGHFPEQVKGNPIQGKDPMGLYLKIPLCGTSGPSRGSVTGTRTQFLRWLPVPKGKSDLPPICSPIHEPWDLKKFWVLLVDL